LFEDDGMLEIRKLKVVVFEDYIDAVVRSLGQAGVVQFIDMREKMEEWKGVLVPHTVPTETMARCSDLLAKINATLENLHTNLDEFHSVEVPISRAPMKKVLEEVEQELTELPIKSLAKIYSLGSRIDDIIETVEIKREQVDTNNIVLKESVEETLEYIEFELSDIEKTIETIGLTDRHILIDRIKSMTLDDKIEIGRKLAELSKFVIESEKFFGQRLITLKKSIESVRRTIEAEKNFGDIRNDLLILKKIVEKEKSIAEQKEKFVRSAKTVYFEAWVPDTAVKNTIDLIKKVSEGNSIITKEAPADSDKVPVITKDCPAYLQAFGKLECAYGYPSSGDIDPLRFFAITFPILFGIMFADVAQGAIFVIVGIIFTLLRRNGKANNGGDIIRYLLISGEMLIYIGLSAIFFGFVFGEFFGPSGVIQPIFLFRIGPFQVGGFEPTQKPMMMLKFAILVGAIHLGLGLILKFINEIKHKHYKLAPIPICCIWLLFGGLFMWAYWGGVSNISKWFAEGSFMFVGLVLSPLIVILVITAIAEGFMEGIGFTVEVFAETLSHSMSYSRIMALGLVHSAMNYLFLVLGGVEHGVFPLQSIPLIAIGTILVMIIEGLVVFVHTLRLHWVEWFSEFHSGEGIPFKPFKST
jgi:V/A-type H+-transporting ATPase subunit I